jgi:hypothetical protein
LGHGITSGIDLCRAPSHNFRTNPACKTDANRRDLKQSSKAGTNINESRRERALAPGRFRSNGQRSARQRFALVASGCEEVFSTVPAPPAVPEIRLEAFRRVCPAGRAARSAARNSGAGDFQVFYFMWLKPRTWAMLPWSRVVRSRGDSRPGHFSEPLEIARY